MVPLQETGHNSLSALKPLLACGLVVTLAGLFVDLQDVKSLIQSTSSQRLSAETCESIIQADTRLSREQLAKLLAIPERDSKARVRQIVQEPYCQLPDLKVRSGVVAEREAYPLEFDPKTQLVILYENDEYAGYRFNFE